MSPKEASNAYHELCAEQVKRRKYGAALTTVTDTLKNMLKTADTNYVAFDPEVKDDIKDFLKRILIPTTEGYMNKQLNNIDKADEYLNQLKEMIKAGETD